MYQQKIFLESDLWSYVLILKEDREEMEGVCVCVRARTRAHARTQLYPILCDPYRP